MTQDKLAKKLAKALLVKEGGRQIESFGSLICVKGYFSALSKEDLLGIPTQNGIEV